MINDMQLAVFSNFLGIILFLLVVLYHYVAVTKPKKEWWWVCFDGSLMMFVEVFLTEPISGEKRQNLYSYNANLYIKIIKMF